MGINYEELEKQLEIVKGRIKKTLRDTAEPIGIIASQIGLDIKKKKKELMFVECLTALCYTICRLVDNEDVIGVITVETALALSIIFDIEIPIKTLNAMVGANMDMLRDRQSHKVMSSTLH